jgi:hypothetical protein
MRSVFLSNTKIIDATIDAFVGLQNEIIIYQYIFF